VSTRDLIELSRAGLGDEVLVALVEADGTVFSLDAPRILELRAAGVSERVITAMLKNASRASAPPAAAAPERAHAAPPTAPDDRDGAPYFVIIGEKPAAPPPPPAPTYIVPWVPLGGTHGGQVRHAQPVIEYRGFGRFINAGPSHPESACGGSASGRAALLLLRIFPICSLLTPWQPGAAIRHSLYL
jgi:hypothetical protein